MSGQQRHLRAVTPVSRERSASSHPYERPAPSHPYERPAPPDQWYEEHPPPGAPPLHYQPYREEEWPQRQRSERVARRDRRQPGDDQRTGFRESGSGRAFGGQVRIATMVHRVNQVARGLAEEAAYRARQPVDQAVGQPAGQPDAEPARQGRVVVFLSGQGGTGSTTLACNVAAAAARAGQAVCVVDLDLQLGDCLATLDLKPQCPMSRLVAEGQGFDWEMLETMLARHESGAHVISQVGCLEELNELTPARLPPLIRHLKRRFTHVIVDGLREFSDNALAVLDMADRIILVAAPEILSIRGAARRLHLFRRLGFEQERILILLNRSAKDSPVSVAAASESLGQEPSYVVPLDPASVQRALTCGISIGEASPGSQIAGELERISCELFGLPRPEPRSSLWSRLWRRRKGSAPSPTQQPAEGGADEARRQTRR